MDKMNPIVEMKRSIVEENDHLFTKLRKIFIYMEAIFIDTKNKYLYLIELFMVICIKRKKNESNSTRVINKLFLNE